MPPERNENPVYTRNRGFAYRADYLGGSRVIFQAWANPGVAESEEKWQIVFHTYLNNRLVKSEWAEKTLDNGNKKATDEFLFSWSLRDTTITYS